MYSNTTGSNNVAVGKESLRNNTTGGSNVMIGYQSGFSNTSGNDNIGIGVSNLYYNKNGEQNISIGNNSLIGNIDTNNINNNISIGYECGKNIDSDINNNIFIGNQVGKSSLTNNGNNIYTQEGFSFNLNDISGDKTVTSFDINESLTHIAVGFPYCTINNGTYGAVKIFKNIDNVWTQYGNTIVGNIENEKFGYTVKISNDGNVIFIGVLDSETLINNEKFTGKIEIYTKYNTIDWLNRTQNNILNNI
jgi:hypothetical protein